MLYFKRPWNENRGDDYSSWGTAVYYFETNHQGEVLRQIEVYESGKTLKYSKSNKLDKYGTLSQCDLILDEFTPFQISQDEFESVWV